MYPLDIYPHYDAYCLMLIEYSLQRKATLAQIYARWCLDTVIFKEGNRL